MDRANRYFDLFVVPNWRSFLVAEAASASALAEGNGDMVEAANRWILAAGMNAAVPAYHLADAIWAERPPSLFPEAKTIASFRKSIERTYCFIARTTQASGDFTLLGAVVDAYKHAELWNASRSVTSNSAIVVTASGFGEVPFGGGNFGGMDQLIIRAKEGVRPLSPILQNVLDMWCRLLGRSIQ